MSDHPHRIPRNLHNHPMSDAGRTVCLAIQWLTGVLLEIATQLQRVWSICFGAVNGCSRLLIEAKVKALSYLLQLMWAA